jgi:hypothetical protein
MRSVRNVKCERGDLASKVCGFISSEFTVEVFLLNFRSVAPGRSTLRDGQWYYNEMSCFCCCSSPEPLIPNTPP